MGRAEPHFEFIVDFIRGRENDERYLAELDTGMLAVPLRDWATPPAYVQNGDARAELMSPRSDPSTPFGRSGTFELLLRYLQSQNMTDPEVEVAYERVQADYLALVEVEPEWLSIVNHPLGAELLSSTADLTAAQRSSEIRRAIDKRFKRLNDAPNWIQSPEWPITNGQPATFIGTLEITGIRHDFTNLYVFIDNKGAVLTVEQST